MQTHMIRVLVSQNLAQKALPDNVHIMPLEPWVAQAEILWEGALPLCAFIDKAGADEFYGSALSRFLAVQKIPVFLEGPDFPEGETEIATETLRQAALAVGALSTEAANLRAESAALRRDYMRLQQSFAETEDFLNAAFAPTFTCARAWALAEGAVSGAVVQRLPVGSIGVVAVDVWAMGAGKGTLRFARLTGADFAGEITLDSPGAGWVRAMLPLPLTGLAEDVVICIESDFALGLSLPVPLEHMHATGANAPLALRVWKGLPGCRISEMEPRGVRYALPASALPEPEVTGGTAKLMRGRDAYSLHPGHDGKMDFVFRGIEVPSAANIAAYTQNFGPEPVTLSLANTDGEVARRNMLSPESHVQVDLFVSEAGKVDLHFKLRAASPLVSVFLRGVEIIPMAE